MRRVEYTVKLGRWTEQGEATFPEGTTDEEIQADYLEWQIEQLDGGWEEIK